jgi:DNA-binding transcriptional ArsR family regulator
MVEFFFTTEDVARTRFAFSALGEAVQSVRVLRDPGAYPIHVPWIREALPAVADLDLKPLLALVPAQGYVPDFLTPAPTGPLPALEEELDRLRAAPVELVRRDVRLLLRGRRPSAPLRLFLERPKVALDALSALLYEYWYRTLAEHWPRIEGLLEGDVLYRARRLTEGGAERLFADLHPSMSWRTDCLRIDRPYQLTRELDGAGLLLVPSAFQWPGVSVMAEPPAQPLVFYPARGITAIWERSVSDGLGGLERALGSTRAQILAVLERPGSTSDLAEHLDRSAPAISQHLGVLRAAGLVVGRRDGRHVIYALTDTGERLLRGARETPGA